MEEAQLAFRREGGKVSRYESADGYVQTHHLGVRMRNHVRTLGILFIIYHALGILIGLALFILLSGIGLISGELEAAGILTLIGVGVAVLLIVLSLPGLVTGFGLLSYRPWARILGMIIAAFHLLEFPIGTAFGVYAFWVLLEEESVMLFK